MKVELTTEKTGKKSARVRPPAPSRDPLETAIAIAADAHAGQRDKSGAPYILHPLRVMMALEDPIERIAAVLHDTVEDSPRTLENLLSAGIPAEAVRLVDLLTRRPKQGKRAYYARLIGDPAARRIKLADLNDNMDARRLRQITQRDTRRIDRYRVWRARLLRAVKESEKPQPKQENRPWHTN